MPEALTSFAAVFKVLSEKADSELPLYSVVAQELGEVYGLLMAAADGAGPAALGVPRGPRPGHRPARGARPGEDKWDTHNNS
ncbi:hypothetical protein ACU686_02835 [Yinghuangia aomiensis]